MKKVLSSILPLLFSLILFSQNNKESITANFFKVFESDPVKAYEELLKNNKWISNSDFETIKIKFKNDLAEMGNYHGYEQLTEKYAGTCYIYKCFFAKFDKMAIRINFLLYKSEKDWRVQNFSYDTDIANELEEAAKAYRFKENYN